MAAQVRRWMWVVNVVAILAGSWLLAGTADAIIANRLGAAPQSAPKRQVTMGGSAGTQATRGLDHYLTPIKKRNVFLHGEPIPDEELVASIEEPSGPADACTVPVEVLASAVVERNPELSLVTLLDNSMSPAKIVVVQVGERIADQGELIAVREEWDEPTLTTTSIAEVRRDNGRVEMCRSDAAKTPGAVAMAPAAGAALPTGEGIKRMSDTQFEVSQAEIDAVLNGGLATMAQDVRIVP